MASPDGRGEPRRFRAVSFDAGETLIRPYPSFAEAFRRLCQEHGLELTAEQAARVDEAAALRTLEYQRRGQTFSDTRDSSREFWLGLYHQTLEWLGADAVLVERLPELLYEGFTRSENYALFEDARPVLEALRERGYVVGITSNWEGWLLRMLPDLGIDHLLDFRVVSGVVGYEKPHPRIYEETIRLANVPAAEILHVGDSLHSDVNGARAVGITPVLVDRANRHADADCRRVRSLAELLDCGLLDGPADS